MFRIGDFSKIAQISGRMLRHYDQLGLLTPEHTDPSTGYRYYTAQQLPRLNRILALKELGLTLEQVSRLLHDDISVDEIRGMFVMKKSQLEQTIEEEIARLRYIESRINQIDNEGQLQNYEIVVKSIPAQRFLSVREICPGFDEARQHLMEMGRLLPAKVGQKAMGDFTAIVYSEMYETENIDLEMGFTMKEAVDTTIELSNGKIMTIRELPAVETVASVTRVGIPQEGHGSYTALGLWTNANNYRYSGPIREVFIQPPMPGKEHQTVTEIQWPVEKIIEL
jgi:DNA-binding transcriptional MerR regulator